MKKNAQLLAPYSPTHRSVDVATPLFANAEQSAEQHALPNVPLAM